MAKKKVKPMPRVRCKECRVIFIHVVCYPENVEQRLCGCAKDPK